MRESVLDSKQWSSVLESLPDPISVHGETGKIVWANEKFCELYSRSLSDLTSLSCEQAFFDGNDTAAPDPRVRVAETNDEVAMGEKLWSVTIRPLSRNSGESGFIESGFIRIMRDVTVERGLHRQLVDAARFASLGQMLFGIAHNVGTPLNIISGYAEFLLMRIRPDERGYKELSAILDQTKRIAVMLNEALDVARPDNRENSAIDIKALLSDSLDLASCYFRRDGIKTQLTCATSPPLIYGKAPRLRQAFFSLLLKAGQNVAAGGHVEVVIAESREMPDGLSVKLLGTDAAKQGHDFSRSLEGLIDDPNAATNSGVGLSIARNTFDETGAVVTFDESEERGTAVVIHLPVKTS